MEPDWTDVERRMKALTMKQLKPVRWWFDGCLGGASTKGEVCQTMASQMRHWWNACAEWGGRDRVRNVLNELEKAEGGR